MSELSENYYSFLKKGNNNDYIDDLKYLIDHRIYHYGNHFKFSKENALQNLKIKTYFFIKLFISIFFSQKKIKINSIINSSYFNIENEFQLMNYNIIKAPWISPTHNFKIFYKTFKFTNIILKETFSNIVYDNKIKRLHYEIEEDLTKYYLNNNIKFICLPQDIGLFEKMSIRICKKINKPSFIFLHGLPGRYNNIDDNRANYLVVWGEQIKINFINAGVPESKIFVSGNPNYKSYNLDEINLKSDLTNVLVLSKSMNGAPHSEKSNLSDRGSLILYLLQIQQELIKIGVKSVKFRPHPSENIKWYYNYIDQGFFKYDKQKSIKKSLKSKSLVIGPTSTVLIDALMNNVNYLAYEPKFNGLDLLNQKIVPPFDNSDSNLKVATSQNELSEFLLDIPIVNKNILKNYIDNKFEINFIRELLIQKNEISK
jgi:hypothetical protein